MKKLEKVSVEFVQDNEANRKKVADELGFDPKTRRIYIAGDDGEYYMLTDKELKAYPIDPDDPNVRTLDFLTGHGVSHAGLEKKHAERIQKNPRFASTGMWLTCAAGVHYLNLTVNADSFELVKDDEDD